MVTGLLHKMAVQLEEPVQYRLQLDQTLLVNEWIGSPIRISFTGKIVCSICQKQIKKTFQDGMCYNCFMEAPEASPCILRPELCQAHLGMGRDVEWEEAHHNQPHVVYLAASDVVKVGVTRGTQIPTRWIDQGAKHAIRLAEVPNRYEAGRLEVELKSFFTDKTNWQRMLKNVVDDAIDLVEEKWSLHDQLPQDLTQYFSEDDDIISINYPVEKYPTKVTSCSLDKTPIIEGVLSGIKGQYLIFDDGKVINIRKHTGYEVQMEKI